MGYSTILDIIGSVIAGGILLLILARTNASAIENTYNDNSDLITQQNLSTVVLLLENDFRKIGYCENWTLVPDPTKTILSADSTSIKFIGDVNNDGTVDTVYYYVGPTSELSGTPNPNDRILYRVVNGSVTKSGNMGITQFSLSYFDDFGNQISFPITTPGSIAEIQITLQIQNTEAYNGQYVTSYLRQIRLAARNLRNR